MLWSCNKEDEPDLNIPETKEEPKEEPEVEKDELYIESFIFKSIHNPLLWDIKCTVQANTITSLIPNITSASGFVPTIEGSFKDIEVDGEPQISGATAHDFNSIVTYKITSKEGKERYYDVKIQTYSGLPVVKIDTENKQAITSKTVYINGFVSISKTIDFDAGYEGAMQIRGRGNATWTSYPKKPFKIKLNEPSTILGMPANRDWVLLAEYCDKSMLRTTYMFELSKLAELPWTPRYHYVDVILNGSYNGTYVLCEHVEEARNRVNIDHDGYLIERNDLYWNQEPLWFTTERSKINFTFKYPDTDEMTRGDESYNFIKNFMDDLETALASSNFTDPDEGYRKYVDTESFAKWYLVQEVLGNIEPNPYYVLKSQTAKLQMYPVWDAEWSLGLAAMENNRWVPAPYVSPVEKYYRKDHYIGRMFEDPYFQNISKNNGKRCTISFCPNCGRSSKKGRPPYKWLIQTTSDNGLHLANIQA